MIIFFDAVVTLLYGMALRVLIREYRASSPAQRRENQTIPVILSATVFYLVLIWKTHWFVWIVTGSPLGIRG